jgi:hypothetical protein
MKMWISGEKLKTFANYLYDLDKIWLINLVNSKIN